MKKISIAFACLFSALPLVAASTCQTRVDKNINKSTAEKIIYCLNDEPEPVKIEKKPEVIVSDIYTAKYPKQKFQTEKQTAAANKQPVQHTEKVQGNLPVSIEYHERNTYPPFRNDTLPRMNAASANDAAITALRNERMEQEKAQKPAKKMAKNKKSKKKNTRAKAAKPATQAASEQVQQAQALQENPLSSPSENSVPEGFEDDSILGPADFGYNDTDPALQQ